MSGRTPYHILALVASGSAVATDASPPSMLINQTPTPRPVCFQHSVQSWGQTCQSDGEGGLGSLFPSF